MTRTAPEWFSRQSAVIPYRRGADGLEIAVITSSSGKRWVVPKGVIDPGETALHSAIRESAEEAGVEGRADPRSIGVYTYEKWGMTCTVEVFLLEVLTVHERWPEGARRRREWVSVEEAAARLREEKLKDMVRSVPDRVGD